MRESELRHLTPEWLDAEACTLFIPKYIDKGRKDRHQPIPRKLAARLAAFAASGEAKKIYDRMYRNQGNRPNKKQPPTNPLIYVPSNSAVMLKKDLDAAGIPPVTIKGKIDFHALRTAYINFVIRSTSDVKNAQELARHETPELTMNTYGRVEDEEMRNTVETVGDIVFPDEESPVFTSAGLQNYTKLTQAPGKRLWIKL